MATKTAVLAGLAQAFIFSASLFSGAQSDPTGKPLPAAAPANHSSSTTPAANDPASNAPSAQPAPGTAPIQGDTPSGAPSKQPAPGTAPLSSDSAATAITLNPDKIVEVGSERIKVKPGSIDDVNAVGNREIGGRGFGNWYSADYETRLGRSRANEVERTTRLITDPVVTEYVNRIGQNIVKNSDCKIPFTIKVIDSDEINAFALPGGFFYVNSGLILNADEEAEVAGVMAHETAHVCAHHIAKEMTRSNYTQIGMLPAMIVIGGWTGYGLYEGSQLAIPMGFLKFSREFEAQADYLGIQYLYRAGYDPQAFITYFEKIQALEKRKPGLVSKAFSDHPQTPERILRSQEEIARILPARDEYIVTTSEFDEVKARLARIENKRRLTDTRSAKKPSLRKADSGAGDPISPDSASGSFGDDDKPTLRSRDAQN
jgi:predicted Zn-dependent protease